VRRDLLALDGVGPWTADYVTMRLLADPDILLHTDLVVRRGAALFGIDIADTGRWAPWRSYLSMHLWKRALAERMAAGGHGQRPATNGVAPGSPGHHRGNNNGNSNGARISVMRSSATEQQARR
jgi:AraC family transcriptional regulator of adaptative response / DNA-3-methyladenine glycosylase II